MHGITFFQDLAVIIITAGVVSVLFYRFRQPIILGYLVAGMVVGPHLLSWNMVKDEATIRSIGELGVVFLMFALGLHFSLRQLFRVGISALIVALLEISIMISLGYGAGRTFGGSPIDNLFLGAMLAISSTTIVVKTLQEYGLQKENFTKLIFAILIIEDILAIVLLVLLSGIATSGAFSMSAFGWMILKLTMFLTGLVFIGLLTIPRTLRYLAKFRNDEILLMVSLGLCLGVALLAQKLNYSVALGSFIIGAVIGETREGGKISTLIMPLRDMFSAIFFVTVGMLIDFSVIWDNLAFIGVLISIVILGKTTGCTLGSFLVGTTPRDSLKIGVSLSQIGEFSFIIAQLGLSLGVVKPTLYPVIVAVSVVTSLTSPYLVKNSRGIGLGFGKIIPNAFQNSLVLYHEWITDIWKKDFSKQNSAVQKIVRRSIRLIAIDLLLSTTIIMSIIAAGRYFQPGILQIPEYLGGMNSVLWLISMMMVLPLLVHTFFKLRALTMIFVEMGLNELKQKAVPAFVHGTLNTTLMIVFSAVLIFWLSLVSLAILPPWPVLLVLVVVLFLTASLLLKHFNKLYTRTELRLYEVFAHHVEVEAESISVADHPLKQANLKLVHIPEQAFVHGRLIRELAIRTQTGASLVGITRGELNLINPDPDEEIHSGDDVLILGTTQQLEACTTLLNSKGLPQKQAKQYPF
ncbi:MAG: cation:proton antiporter [SAR324 cluster bacterium]|nr:cation:proton antiporter [SAR324 cluster bacterium]